MVLFKPSASVFVNPKFILVFTISGYGLYCYDDQGVTSIIAPDAEDAVVGKAIRDSLFASRNIYQSSDSDIPEGAIIDDDFFKIEKRISYYDSLLAGLMKRFSYKTKSAMFKQLKRTNLRLSFDEKTILARPLKQAGLDSWASYSKRQDVVISYPATDEEIGKAFRQSMKNAL